MPRVRKPAPGGYATRDAQAAAAPTGMAYGQHQASIDSQKVVPLPNVGAAPTAPGPTPAPSAPGAAPSPAPFDMQAALAAAAAHSPPAGGFGDPTTQPHVPVTAGSPTGPGPGPSAIQAPYMQQGGGLATILAGIAAASGSSDLQILAQQARNLGQ